MTFAPMLAVSAPATDETIARLQGTHYYDLKIDGVRGLLIMQAGVVKLQNRNGVDITYRYPELVQAALAKFGSDVRLILDGEIVGLDENGKPSFKLTAKRDRQQRPAIIAALAASKPVTFIAFDLLYRGSGPEADRRNRPWQSRTDELTELLQGTPVTPRITGNPGSTDGYVMMALVREHSLEGLVAKRMDSPYQSGRRSQWVKIKPTSTASFLVVGTTQGSGSRSDTFGALELAVYRSDGSLRRCGEVGSGFKQRDLTEVLDGLAGGQKLIVEVEFQEVTVDGALRFPVFKGIRTDLTLADVTEDQIGVPCVVSKSSSEPSLTNMSLPDSS